MNISQKKLREIMQGCYELGIQEGWGRSTIKDNAQQGTGEVTADIIMKHYQPTIDREVAYEINQLKGIV